MYMKRIKQASGPSPAGMQLYDQDGRAHAGVKIR